MNKKIVYRVNASREGGYGHLGRCLALSRYMEGAGCESVFLLGPDVSGSSIAFFGATDATYQLPKNYTDAMEMDAMKRVIDLARPSAIVVDLLTSNVWMMEMIATSKIPLLAIDDIFKNNHRADIIVSVSPLASSSKYPDSSAKLLLGSDYVLLRPEFAKAAIKKNDDEVSNKIYISFGGSDPQNYTQRLADTLGLIEKDLTVSIVVGSGYHNYDSLLEKVSNSGVKVDMRQNEKEPWRLMKGARLAVCSIGNTLWELMCMGVPSIVLSQNDNQAGYANELAEREAIIHFARNSEFKDEELARAIDELMSDADKRKKMADKGRKMIDGKGVTRVAKVLMERIGSV